MDEPRPPKIAILDDDESVRESLVGLVETVGYDVAFFSSAEEFLSLAHLDQFACLIFDVRLPGMSGLQLYCHLRTDHQRIPTDSNHIYNRACGCSGTITGIGGGRRGFLV